MYRKKRSDFTDDVLPWLDFGVQLIMLYYVVKVCEKEHRQGGKPPPAIIEISQTQSPTRKDSLHVENERTVENEMPTHRI